MDDAPRSDVDPDGSTVRGPSRQWLRLRSAAPFLAAAAVVIAVAGPKPIDPDAAGSSRVLLEIGSMSLGLLFTLAAGMATASSLPVIGTAWVIVSMVLFVFAAALTNDPNLGRPSAAATILFALTIGVVVHRRVRRMARRE